MKNAAWVKVLIAISTVFLLLHPGGFTAAAAPQADLQIALLSPMSGPVPDFGASVKNGVDMAVAEWNAKGGVLGRTVSIALYDTQCNGAAATTAANSVVSAGIHYIIGEVCSGASIPISQIAEANHIVQIAPVSTNTQVTLNGDGTVKQYVFRACFIDPFQGQMMARFALRQGWTKAFIMHDPANDYSAQLADAFYKAYTPGDVVGYDTYSGGAADYTEILGRIKASNATVVYLPDFVGTVNTILAQAKNLGVTAPFLGSDAWASGGLDMAAAEGAFYTDHFSADNPDPAVKQWVDQYKTTYSATPDSTAALAYDSTNILLNAIKAAGADDAAAVKDALARGSFSTVTGQVRFDANHNPQKNVVIQQIKNNALSFFSSFIEYRIFLPTSGKGLPANTPTVKACLVTDVGGVNDNGFNSSAWKGMLDAQAALRASVSNLESLSADDYSKNINTFISQNCDLIETVGFLMGDATQKAATANPNQKFSIVDYSYSPTLSNVLSQTYSVEQNSFLVGYLAAGMTKTNKVSTFGGMAIPTVIQFMDGYYQGVQYYNKENGTNVQVIGWDPSTQTGDFTGDFGSVTAGNTMAQTQIGQGSDIVFPVAGQTGLGAAEAVKNTSNAWVIGVDVDWVYANPQYSDIVLTSAIKNMRASTYSTVLSVANGTFSGGTYIGTLKNNGVSLGTISSSVPLSLVDKMNQVKAGIIAGSISVNP